MNELVQETQLALFGPTEPGCCVKCKQPFSKENVYTEAGWKETKLSKLCEKCWDATFKDVDDETDE